MKASALRSGKQEGAKTAGHFGPPEGLPLGGGRSTRLLPFSVGPARRLRKADMLKPPPNLEEGHPSDYDRHYSLLSYRACGFPSLEGLTNHPLMDTFIYHNRFICIAKIA